MNDSNFLRLGPSGVGHSAIASLICTLLIVILMIPTYALAQAAPITSSGLNTQVSTPSTLPNGQVQYDITGGTRPGNGVNLFHSFGQFNVPSNNVANFFNDTGLTTSNILSRVTEVNHPSMIFGTIRTTDFGNANLFLINPAGIVFGPNATLNVGGSVTFTTANNLRLNDGALFNAVAGPADALLSAAPVAAFGFLGSNPGTITVQGSNLSVQPGQAINLVGGDISIAPADIAPGTVQTARITAPGGQINMVSVASAGEVLALNYLPASSMSLGSINLGTGTLVDVSGDAAGTVHIRSGQLVMENATISANTAETNGAPVAIDMDVSGDLVITSNNAPAFTARTTGAGDAGDIHLASGSLTATSIPNGGLPFSLIESYTVGSGKAGSIHLKTGELNVATDPSSPVVFIDSGTGGLGNGGNIAIDVKGEAHFSNTRINTGDSFLGGSGSAGNISIKADTLTIIAGTTFAADSVSARGGDMTLEAHEIALSNSSFLDVLSLEGGSAISITADRLTVNDSSSILNQTAQGPGGGITITAKSVEVTNSSLILSQTFGDGNAGNIHVTATDHVTVTDDPQLGGNPSGFYTNSLGNAGLGTNGSAGAIEITTPHLTLSGGARINSTTQSSGQGGDVTITAQNVTLSGQRTLEVDSELFGLGGTKATGIYTRTVGSEFCAGPCGDAGRVTITTGSLTINGGAVIDSGTTNNGQGGSISVNATGRISISGTLNDGIPGGIFSRTIGMASDSGSGGNLALTDGQSITISNGAAVSASSTGPGNAGNISINAGQQLDIMGNSSIKTEAKQAKGGNIDIQAVDRVRLVNSSISTSVLDSNGNSGNISIDPNVVVLQNSQVIAQAVQGTGGNITITTPLFLRDSTSLVDASTPFGLNGTVTIQSPTSNLSASLGTLPSEPNQTHSLLTQRCAALVNGQTSSFVVAGREQFPADPGGWLTSSLAFPALGESLDAGHAGVSTPAIMAIAAHDTGTVSLRRLTPAGFLMANFADSEATGCHS